MTDEEIICTWMEPSHMDLSVDDLCWHGVRFQGKEMGYFPRVLNLDALWEVERRLTGEQWSRYQDAFWVEWKIQAHNPNVFCLGKILLHATAEQKIAALAAVLRPIVEASNA